MRRRHNTGREKNPASCFWLPCGPQTGPGRHLATAVIRVCREMNFNWKAPSRTAPGSLVADQRITTQFARSLKVSGLGFTEAEHCFGIKGAPPAAAAWEKTKLLDPRRELGEPRYHLCLISRPREPAVYLSLSTPALKSKPNERSSDLAPLRPL